MDHIPAVISVSHNNRLDIPLYCSPINYVEVPLGFEAFERYPETCGHSLQTPFDLTESSTCAFLQSWLFFGLLAEAFGGHETRYKHSDFVTIAESGRQSISTKMLQKYSWYWLANRSHGNRKHVALHAQSFDNCLRLASSAINGICKSTQLADSGSFLEVKALLLSLATLGEYMYSVREMVVKYDEVRRSVLSWQLPFLDAALLESGWCKGEIAVLRRQCNTTCLYFLSQIDRRDSSKDHSRCNPHNGCRALQVNEKTYRTLHRYRKTDTECGCKPTGPVAQDIAQIIEAGNIPLISFGNSSNSQKEVSTSHYHSSNLQRTTYVAISHVWSDGLGNVTGNWLNGCQLDHIQGLVNALYEPEAPPVPFWMDTLCVPVQSAYKHLRAKAIVQMADIYKLADKVLVLDQSLQSVTSKTAWVESLMRLAYCPWATRLWTLQEARFGRRLFFQFKDGVIEAAEYQDSARLNGSLTTISETLKSSTDAEIMATPSARRIAEALATYEPNEYMVQLVEQPAFEDEEMESLRQTAILNLPTIRIAQYWYLRATSLGLRTQGTDADEHLRSDIFVWMVCPIARRSIAAINKVRGWAYSRLNVARDKHDPSLDVQRYEPHALFLDACNGLVGRTTSRLEDETICLATLLQADVAAILRVEKSDLAQAYQEARMKVLLQLVGKVPTSVAFWNVSRMQVDGWGWAPRSVLRAKMDVDIISDSRADIQDGGLRINVSGFKLGALRGRVESRSKTIVIHTNEDEEPGIHPWRRTWQYLRLLLQQPLNDLAGQDLAVLIHQNHGILVRIRRVEDGCCFCHHLAIVERIEPMMEVGAAGNDRTLRVSGRWVMNGAWCIG